jgi:hypothetical protein
MPSGTEHRGEVRNDYHVSLGGEVVDLASEGVDLRHH